MKKKTPKIKEISIKALRKKAWDLQSKVIRQKEKGICFTCGAKNEWKKQQAGHFVHGHAMDFVEENIHCQCPRCNKWLSGNLIQYAIHLEKKYGYGIVQKLKRQSDKIKKYKVQELQDIIDKNKKLLKKYE